MADMRRPFSPGFSLLEVLIALVIFSFSLVGVAGLMSISMKGNHNGYLRSQAVLLSQDINSRMRANLAGLWEGSYNGLSSTVGEAECSLDTPCTPAQLAEYDKLTWSKQLAAVLPGGEGMIECDTPDLPPGILSSGLWVAYPPFPGICSITINWYELNESGQQAQNVRLVVQP